MPMKSLVSSATPTVATDGAGGADGEGGDAAHGRAHVEGNHLHAKVPQDLQLASQGKILPRFCKCNNAIEKAKIAQFCFIFFSERLGLFFRFYADTLHEWRGVDCW